MIGALMAGRALAWLPGPVLFFARLGRIRDLPSNTRWTEISLYLRCGEAAISGLIALLALGIGIAMLARLKRARSVAPLVLWSMLALEALTLIALVVPDLLFLPRIGGHWLPTLASLGLTAREALGDIGWAAVLIIFLKRLERAPEAPVSENASRAWRPLSIIATIALLVAFREGAGIISAPFALNSFRSTVAAGAWLSPVAVASGAAVAAPLIAIICALSLAFIPRMTRLLAAGAVAMAIVRQAAQLALIAPSGAMTELTIAAVYFAPAAMILEYAVMAWALARAKP
jgi:hypothetical protein